MKKCLTFISIFLICTHLSGCFGIARNLIDLHPAPPAGTYAVSSIGTEDGSVEFYSQITDEVMVINEDGTGTFYYGETLYDIAFKNGALHIDGERIQYIYTSGAPEESLVVVYWFRDGVNSIALRPVNESAEDALLAIN